MIAIKNDALSIAKAIEVLEAPLADIRKQMPGYKEIPSIVSDGGDVDLLDGFISGVNFEVGEEVLQKVGVTALSTDSFHEWLVWVKASIPFAVIWAAIRKYCGLSRCSIKVKAGEDEVDVSAATAEDAERLLRVARLTIYRLGDASEKTESEQDAPSNPQ